MLKFETNGKLGRVEMNLPTSIKEITPDYLLSVTDGIKVGDNYSLIGLVYYESLSSVILANNRKQKSVTTAVVPIFVKSGNTDADYIKSIKVGEKIIIAPSDISLGHHVTCPANLITINNILNYTEGDKDIYGKALANNRPCCYLEFKLVPNCNIHGSYDDEMKATIDNPFIKMIKEG